MPSSKVRQYLIIVALVFAAWIVVSMSQTQTYRTPLRVEWYGYDSARYVVAHADTDISLNINSNGFKALHRWREMRFSPLRLNADSDTSYALVDVLAVAAQQYGASEIEQATANKASLSLRLSERCRKAFVPDISAISFSFADQFGISGAVSVVPDTVYLYGSQSSLDEIDGLSAHEVSFSSINKSGDYVVDLEPVWEEYADVRPSDTKVRVRLNVEKYVEKRLNVPVVLSSEDTSLHVRLYPDNVTVALLVPMNEYKNVSSEMVEVQAIYSAEKSQLPLLVTRFPSNCRVKQLLPDEVEYVALKK